MLATVVGLELLLQEPSIDLDVASALILRDVGATLHILRLIGNDYVSEGNSPKRMYDCLASMEVNVWFRTISSHSIPTKHASIAISELWSHSRLIAHYARLIAESLGDIIPEDAYLVGLLHEAETIPMVLGWKMASINANTVCRPELMEGSLPLFVLAALRCVDRGRPLSVWKLILSEAHLLALTQPDSLEVFPELSPSELSLCNVNMGAESYLVGWPSHPILLNQSK
jgi:hypothetical protein